jgi:hypothetical protein
VQEQYHVAAVNISTLAWFQLRRVDRLQRVRHTYASVCTYSMLALL